MPIFIHRSIQKTFLETLAQGKSILLLGPRQVGKTTFLKQLKVDYTITFADPSVRQEIERNLNALKLRFIALNKQLGKKPLVVIDEVQKIPEVMDLLQYLIDENVVQFIITGSSARKLKQPGKTNLLPGRVIIFHLDPFSLSELDQQSLDLNSLLLYGSLPEVYLTTTTLKDRLLQSYVLSYLEEEIRLEAVVRNVSHFSQFLELAAIESGNSVNFSKIAQEIGIAHTTIGQYYQILEDCLVAFRVESFIGHTTRRLLKAPKYLLFDMGVKRISARESLQPSRESMGRLFEQWIGLELLRYKNLNFQNIHIKYWRSYEGIEVDWIIETPDHLVPIEVKLTQLPTLKDVRHIHTFMEEYPRAQQGYIICTTDFEFEITHQIRAISWQQLPELLARVIK